MALDVVVIFQSFNTYIQSFNLAAACLDLLYTHEIQDKIYCSQNAVGHFSMGPGYCRRLSPA